MVCSEGTETWYCPSDMLCHPEVRCVAASQNPGTALEEVTFNATRDATYYAVVDGYDGAVSGYTLEILCTKQ